MDLLQSLQPFFDFFAVHLDGGGDHGGVEFDALHAGSDQQLAIHRVEALDGPFDQAADRVGHFQLEMRPPLGEPPFILLFRDDAAVGELPHQIDNEQRRARGAFVQQADEVVGKPIARIGCGQIPLQIIPAEGTQPCLAPHTAPLKGPPHVDKRVLGEQQVRWAVGDHQQQAQRVEPIAEVRDQVDGRHVRPMEVVEEQDERPRSGQFSQERMQLPLHLFCGPRSRFGGPLQTGWVVRCCRMELSEPGGRHQAQDAGDLFRAVAVKEPIQRFKKRQIRLAAGEPL
jgi:hypothetical protein